MRVVRAVGLWAALFSALILPTWVQAQPVSSSAQRLANLEAAVSALTQAVSALQAENAAQSTLLQTQANAITALQAALNKQIADSKAYTDGKVAPVADKLIHFSRTGNEVYITGANLNIRSGKGHTYGNGVNGLGNLIVGYNELRGTGDRRTGSHNFVIGLQNNYSSAGAIVAGSNNGSTNYMASFYGGTGNISGGYYSAVVGGYDNRATGNWSSVLGGQGVRATTQLARVP